MNKKKYTIPIVILLVIIAVFVDNMLPKELGDESFFDINPVNNTEYVSAVNTIGKYKVCTYAFVNAASSESGEDEFTVAVAKLEGMLKNRYMRSITNYIWKKKCAIKN